MFAQKNRHAGFLFIKLLFVIREMLLKNKGGLLLVHSVTFIIRKLACLKQAVGCFFSLFG